MESSTYVTLPCSRESEIIVLGRMLVSAQHFRAAITELDETAFYFTEHQIIFNTLKALYEQGKTADILFVNEELKQQNKLETASRMAYLTMLAQDASHSTSLKEHIEDLKKYAQLRQLLHLAQKMAKNAIDLSQDPIEIVIEACEQIKLIEKCKSEIQEISIFKISKATILAEKRI